MRSLLILAVAGFAALAAASFVDIDGNPHQGDIEAVAAAGITRGCNPPASDRYCPDRDVTRGEMAAFLARALELDDVDGDPFFDDDESVFEGDIAGIHAAGITLGCNPPENDRYCPDRFVTRGEMAAFLRRAFDLEAVGGDPFVDDDGSPFEGDISALHAAGITVGCNPPDNDRYCPHDRVERDQMASFLARGLDLDLPALPSCRRWVDEEGADSAAGTRDDPWATIQHAVDSVPVAGCVISVEPGAYEGARIAGRFTLQTVVRSSVPQGAHLIDDETVLDVQGARNVTIEGFEISHADPASTGVVVNVEDANDLDSSNITIRNNIIHDSFDDDLLKIRSGARFVTVTGNSFFNQGANEQHIDVNGVQDITIEANLFANDFAASDRDDPGDTKAYIVVKDSSATGDELGSRRVSIRRNVFMSWQGGRETFLQIGNDGKPYHEAIDVTIENNLLLGDSLDYSTGPLGIAGVKDVSFLNNTVVGDLPSGAYVARFDVKEENQPNQNIVLANNIYADPAGTMGDFTDGDESDVRLDTNVYWNDGGAIDEGGPIGPDEDPNAVYGDPRLVYDHSSVVAPIWNGITFASGSATVVDEFVRIVETYAPLGAGSSALDRADAQLAPSDDILGRPRGSSPDLGAMERVGTG